MGFHKRTAHLSTVDDDLVAQTKTTPEALPPQELATHRKRTAVLGPTSEGPDSLNQSINQPTNETNHSLDQAPAIKSSASWA